MKPNELTKPDANQFTAEQVAFIEYLANPRDTREQQELAKELKISESTLWRWKQSKEFQDAVWNRITDHVKTDDLAGIWQGLIREAKKGDARAVKLIFEVMGKYSPTVETNVQVNNFTVVRGE